MQSQKRSKKQKPKPLSLAWGHGSMSLHGRCWWLVWRDSEGLPHYENSYTDNPQVARKILAIRALPRARAAVALLEQIANEELHQGNGEAGGAPSDPGAAGRNRRKTSANPRPRKGSKTPAGGTN
jgi:hypothetical protein